MAATGTENSLPVITLKDLKDAADRGPIYVMLVFGGGAIAAAVSVQAAASKFNTAEFIATIATGVALIFGAGVLFLILMTSYARTLMEISKGSSETAKTGMEVMKDAVDKLSQQDGLTQRDLAKGINLMAQSIFVPAGVTPSQDQKELAAS
jgi:hypothetical protein